MRTLTNIPPYWESFREALYKEMGDPKTDSARLRRISPLFNADKIKVPLMVLQGANDPRVLKVESDEIVAAAKKNGVPVEYVVFPDEGHGFVKKENEIRGYSGHSRVPRSAPERREATRRRLCREHRGTGDRWRLDEGWGEEDDGRWLHGDCIVYDVVQTPIDRLVVASDGSAIVGVWMANAEPDERRWADRCGTDRSRRGAPAARRVFRRSAARRSTCRSRLTGRSFSVACGRRSRKIPFGTTISYATLARRVSNAAAVRAVGAANGRNPIPIIIPCHRVIGSDGSLTGFGGGLDRKRGSSARRSAGRI